MPVIGARRRARAVAACGAAVFGLLLIGAIVGIVLWRKSQSRDDDEAAASA